MKYIFNMKKTIFLIVISLFIVSCSNDDSELDPSLKLDSYIEPYLNFLVNEETFLAANGPADERRQPQNPGFVLYYNRDLDGVIEYAYGFTISDVPEGELILINVRLEPNSHNLNLVRNRLIDIYGLPSQFVDEDTDVLVFPPTDTYTISLLSTRDNFTADETPRLLVSYSRANN